MKIAFFAHSFISDWNHGNAHFLRGIAVELLSGGHQVSLYEPKSSWSLSKLVKYHGEGPIKAFHEYFPTLTVNRYEQNEIDLNQELDDKDLVIVHEWNDHDLVARIGCHHKQNTGYKLLFHDTHHRSVTDPLSMKNYDLKEYDGVLAFGEVVKEIYLENGWAQNAWVWHEAADTRIFRPVNEATCLGDLIWIGNWGDEERSREIMEFLVNPVKELKVRSRVHGVRFPSRAHRELSDAGIEYAGWIPNYRVPQMFSKYRVTLHIPRSPYIQLLKGIPTIRVFEALACGIPLICSPWEDSEHLFTPGKDFLVVKNGREMKQAILDVLNDSSLSKELSTHGRKTIMDLHTCTHRVDQLLQIVSSLGTSHNKTCIL